MSGRERYMVIMRRKAQHSTDYGFRAEPSHIRQIAFGKGPTPMGIIKAKATRSQKRAIISLSKINLPD